MCVVPERPVEVSTENRFPGVRSNIYFNYTHAHYNVMTREPTNCHHFYLPPQQRSRLTPARLELTKWMEHARWDY